MNIVTTENADLDFKNNFVKAEFTDIVKTILDEYTLITGGLDEKEKLKYSKYGFDELSDSDITHDQLRAL